MNNCLGFKALPLEELPCPVFSIQVPRREGFAGFLILVEDLQILCAIEGVPRILTAVLAFLAISAKRGNPIGPLMFISTLSTH
jgi:hypothetical protein